MKRIIFILMLLAIEGCESLSQRHASRALLLTESSITDQKYSLKSYEDDKFYSGNPIFIHNNTKFSIKIEEISAGWIYKEGSPHNHQSAESGYSEFSLPVHDSKIMSDDDFNHFRGLDLWLLTTISSLNPNDPLETKNKRYFKATNVKFDSQSYSFVPLDSDEQYVFTHESDSSYRIKFQLYSVKGFAIKRELSKIASNPGIWGIGSAILTTLKNTFGSIAGDVIAATWNEKISEDLAMERFLLSMGATEELHANLVIIRKGNFESRRGELQFNVDDIENIKGIAGDDQLTVQLAPFKKDKIYSFPTPLKKTSYLVLDYFKEVGADPKARGRGGDSKGKKMFDGKNLVVNSNDKVLIDSLPEDSNNFRSLNDFTYLKIAVTESDSTQKFVDNSGRIKSNKSAAFFTDSVIPLMQTITTNKVTSLEDKLAERKADMNAICPNSVCDEAVLKGKQDAIKKAQDDLDVLKRSNQAGLSALEKIKSKVSLEEWIEHIQRQPD